MYSTHLTKIMYSLHESRCWAHGKATIGLKLEQRYQRKWIPKGWFNSTYGSAFDPEVKGKAWAAMSGIHDLPRPKMWRRNKVSDFNGGIVETLDGGKTWKPISAQIGEGAMTHILMDPSTDKVLKDIIRLCIWKRCL
jgi:hypothetical protein